MNQGNVSSFYNDDIDELEERKEDGLRIPNRSESERPTEARNFRGGKDIELQQPIMQIMQMHQQFSGSKKRNQGEYKAI